MKNDNTCPWVLKVHAYCLRTGNSVTSRQAQDLFGRPPNKTAAGQLMHSAARIGYFHMGWTQPAAGHGARDVRLFTAIPRSRKSPTVTRLTNSAQHQQSWFTGLKRCRSVFELGSIT